MTESLPASPSSVCLRLGTAQYVVALLVTLGLADLALRLTWEADFERIQYAGVAVFSAVALGLCYLALTVLCAWQWAGRLRKTDRIAPRDLAAAGLGHAAVLAVAVYIYVLGGESQALYTGLDRLVATLVVASLLALLLTLTVRVWQRSALAVAGPRSRLAVCVFAAGLLQVAALLWLEFAP